MNFWVGTYPRGACLRVWHHPHLKWISQSTSCMPIRYDQLRWRLTQLHSINMKYTVWPRPEWPFLLLDSLSCWISVDYSFVSFIVNSLLVDRFYIYIYMSIGTTELYHSTKTRQQSFDILRDFFRPTLFRQSLSYSDECRTKKSF